MLCGVKFCGGCNPRYDRVKAFEKLRLQFLEERADGLEFQFVKEGVPYDVLLVIGGCPACCASYSQYDVEGLVVKMWSEEQIGAAVQRLREIQ